MKTVTKDLKMVTLAVICIRLEQRPLAEKSKFIERSVTRYSAYH